MNPANKAILEDYRQYWLTLKNAGYMMGLSGHVRDEMVRIMGEEFRPGYTADLWCPPCVADMVTALYFEFEKWEAAQPAPTAAAAEQPVEDPAALKALEMLLSSPIKPIDAEKLREEFEKRLRDLPNDHLILLDSDAEVQFIDLSGTEESQEGYNEATLSIQNGELTVTTEEEPKPVEPRIEEPPIEPPAPPPVPEPAKPRIIVKSAFPSNKPKGRR